MEQRICLITGANAGIGKEVALGLAQSGARVILVCRNAKKGEETLREIKKISGSKDIDLFIADMSSQSEIKNLSKQLHRKYKKLHVLINNAGLSVPKKMLSADGIELTLATNHLGPFLLSHLLVDLLEAASPSRIINISSSSHQWANLDLSDVQFQQKSYRPMRAYSQSKLLLTMTSYDFAFKFAEKNITVNSLHPGVIHTDLLNKMAIGFIPKALRKLVEKPLNKFLSLFMSKPKTAAKPIINLALSPETENISGQYFEKSKLSISSKITYNSALRKKVWDMSERLVGLK